MVSVRKNQSERISGRSTVTVTWMGCRSSESMCHSLGNRMNEDIQSRRVCCREDFTSECIAGSSYCELSHCDRHLRPHGGWKSKSFHMKFGWFQFQFE